MKRFIFTGLLCFGLCAFAQETFFVGQSIHVSDGETLFTQNQQVKLAADIVTQGTGTLTVGSGTSFLNASPTGKIAGHIRDYPPFDIPSYPVGTTGDLRALSLYLANDNGGLPIEISYDPGVVPDNTALHHNVTNLWTSGYWTCDAPNAYAQLTFRVPLDHPLLQASGPDLFSIAGWNGSNWKILPTAFDASSGLLSTYSSYPLGTYQRFAVALRRCAQSTTWNGLYWTNGEPQTTDYEIVFEGDYSSEVGSFGLTGCTMEIEPDADVTLKSGYAVTIKGKTMVDQIGSLLLESNAALIQTDNDANEGQSTVRRNAMMRRQDYVYWGSPVTGQNLHAFSPQTLQNRFYVYDETTAAFKAVFTATGLNADPLTYEFQPANGYMVRAPNNFLDPPAAAQLFTGHWTGTLQNGDYGIPLTNGAGNGVNLLGNPYPSPVNANLFLAENPGTLYFWAHLDQVPGNGNYAMYNLLGGVAASVPAAGGGTVDSEVPNGTIQTGQGFLLDADAAYTAMFRNSMRTTAMGNQFFRSSFVAVDRYCLNLSDATTGYNQVLVGYDANATTGFDTSFDGRQLKTGTVLSTIVNGEKMGIQGRPSFTGTDEIGVFFECEADGTYTIALDRTSGVFATTPVYLQDLAMGIDWNLTVAPYTFTSIAGSYPNRFTVHYQTNLDVPDHDAAHEVAIYSQQDQIEVVASTAVIRTVSVFDLRGRLLSREKATDATRTRIGTHGWADGIVIVVVETDKGNVTRKVGL